MMATRTSQSLLKLLSGVVVDDTQLRECQLTDISMDSRRVVAGGCFVALATKTTDRERHLQQALEKDCFAVLFDADQPLSQYEVDMLKQAVVTGYPVRALAEKAGLIAAKFFDYPSKSMHVIAITGTNGKTSVSQFIAQALEGIHQACGVIGTMGAGRISDLEMTGMTTPDPITMQRLLAKFKHEGCRYVALEASSHALEQGRLNNVEIDVAVLTNLSRDHLDYHKTMEAYGAAKKRLFDMASVTHAVINADDSFGQSLININTNHHQLIKYSLTEKAADLMADNIHYHSEGISFTAVLGSESFAVNLPVLGRFNVENILAAVAALSAIGLEAEQLEQAINECYPVTGRMQTYSVAEQALVVVDYAHTPDALEQALLTLQKHLPKEAELWCVFGCGGDRDIGKRPLMGEVAVNLADYVILTDDNPRTEASNGIVKDILSGCGSSAKMYVEHDRKKAIGYAIQHAQKNDIVLIAGKGHESYQEIDNRRYRFCDGEVVTDFLVAPVVNQSRGGQ